MLQRVLRLRPLRQAGCGETEPAGGHGRGLGPRSRHPCELGPQQLEVNHHRVERILHLVREAGREAAERHELARGLSRVALLRQLLADGVEERAQVTELVVLIEVERDAELPFPEPRQSAADHVDRPQEQLREQRGDDDGDEHAGNGDVDRRPQRGVQFLTHQHRRDADANRPERRVAEHHLLAHFERAPIARVDGAELVERGALDERREIGA